MKKVSYLKQKLIIFSVYAAVILVFYHFDIGCVFLRLFSVPCPGCGMTRALLSALKLDFVSAFSYHPMFWSLPFVFAYLLFDGSLFKRKWLNVTFFIIIAVGFVVNWIFRLTN